MALEELGNEALILTQRKIELEILLKEVTDRLKVLEETTIVDEMLTSFQKKVKLNNGVEFTLKKEYHGGISYENAERGMALLTELGYQRDWAINMKVKDKNTYDRLKEELGGQGHVVQGKPDLPAQTFKSLCRKLDEAGEITHERKTVLGVVTQHKAVIKPPKEA